MTFSLPEDVTETFELVRPRTRVDENSEARTIQLVFDRDNAELLAHAMRKDPKKLTLVFHGRLDVLSVPVQFDDGASCSAPEETQRSSIQNQQKESVEENGYAPCTADSLSSLTLSINSTTATCDLTFATGDSMLTSTGTSKVSRDSTINQDTSQDPLPAEDNSNTQLSCGQAPMQTSEPHICCHDHQQFSRLKAMACEPASQRIDLLILVQALNFITKDYILPFYCLLDTGSEYSYIDRSFLRTVLGWHEGPRSHPIGAVDSFGDSSVFLQDVCEIVIRLCSNGRDIPVKCFILPEGVGWKGPSMILGRQIIVHAQLLQNGAGIAPNWGSQPMSHAH